MDVSGLGMLALIAATGFLWVLPILIIITSNKTTGGEKVAWVLAVLFISWFAWIFYMLLAPIKTKNECELGLEQKPNHYCRAWQAGFCSEPNY